MTGAIPPRKFNIGYDKAAIKRGPLPCPEMKCIFQLSYSPFMFI